MVDEGSVPLDRIARRSADEDLAHQRVRPGPAFCLGPSSYDLICRRDAAARSAAPRSAPPRSAQIAAGAGLRAAAPIHSGNGPGGRPAAAAAGRPSPCRCDRRSRNVRRATPAPARRATPSGPRARLVVPAEALEPGGRYPLPQADLDAPARDVVDHRQILGQAQRINRAAAPAPRPGRCGSAALPRRAQRRRRSAKGNSRPSSP